MKARWLVLATIVVAAQVFAQPADGGNDGGPDDRQGMMPRDERGSEEGDDNSSCIDDRDCDRGFVCRRLVCVPSTPKSTPACGGPAAALVFVGVGMMRRRR
jgi:hypothetical protein